MELSRRQVLSLVPAAGLLAAAKPGVAAAAEPEPGLVRLLANTVTIFAGSAGTNARPEVAGKVAAIERTARADLVAMDAAGAGELFAGLPLGTSDPNLTSSFQRLYEIALATRAPGTGLAGDAATRQRVLDGYEYMNGENLMPWFQGDGAYHLYLSGQDQTRAYGVDYYTTVSPYRLAGVTAPVEERRTVPELYGRFWYENPTLGFTSSSAAQNKYVYFPRGTNGFSGGVTLGAYGLAGMTQSDDVPWVDTRAGLLPADFVAYQNARSVKSWFLLDDEVVVLAAGVGDPAGRPTVTTVDSRIAAPADDVVLTGVRRDGRAWSGAGTAELSWLRYANRTEGTSVGYVFLDRQRVSVELAPVTRSRRVVRTSNPDTPVTRNVFGVTVQAGSLAYALVPNASDRPRTRVRVLANDRRVQAVTHPGLRLVGVNTFTDGWHHADRLAVHGPASVLLRRENGAFTLAVADPTMTRDRVDVIVRGTLREVSADAGVTVRRVPGGTQGRVTTRQAYGRTFLARLS